MKTSLFAAPAAAAIAALLASPAAAATFADAWTVSPSGNISVVFGDNGMDIAGAETVAGETVTTHDWNSSTGAFTDTFSFFLPDGLVGFTLSSIGFVSSDSINLSSFTFNGQNVHFTATSNGAGGVTITGADGPFTVHGGSTQTLTVAGSAGPDAVYDGTATFRLAPGGVVPEPATWALMIAGFGGAGAVLRRRRSIAVA